MPQSRGQLDGRIGDGKLDVYGCRPPEETMSSSVAAVLALILSVPTLVCILVFATAGVSSSFMTGALTFVVIVSAAVGAVFEIKRLADT
jgi:hypothetical protein